MAINLAEIKPAVLKAKEVATINDIDIAEANFNAAIATTNSYVATINNTLSDIASDAKLTAGEKQAVKREWETIVAEKPSLVDQATSFGVSSTVYTDKYNALDSYLNTPIGSALLTSLITTSDIVSNTFTTKFKEYYTAKIDLLNALAAKAKEVADSKVNSAYVTTAIANSGYVLPSEVAAAVNNNTTTIEGSKITTGSISASKINTQGLIAENISADTIIGKNIAGGSISGVNIEGVNITGAVIKASWIDYTSVGALTDWAVYTTSTIPSQYAANFAHNNDGTLTVSSGYVKLPTVSGVMSVPATASAGACGDHGGSAWSAGGVQNQLHSNASYTSSSTRRFVRAQPMFNALSVATPIIQLTH